VNVELEAAKSITKMVDIDLTEGRPYIRLDLEEDLLVKEGQFLLIDFEEERAYVISEGRKMVRMVRAKVRKHEQS
jgi:hypothetical protein